MNPTAAIGEGEGACIESRTDGVSQLISICDLDNGILAFPNVILNGKQQLKSIELLNQLKESRVHVHLRSDLGSQLTFQLTNENFAHLDESNTPSEHFNQVFNFEQLIDEVILMPAERKSIVVALLPSDRTTERKPEDLGSRPNYQCTSLSGSLMLEAVELVDPPQSAADVRPRRQELTVYIACDVCRSFIEVDTHVLSFENCVPREKYVKDFTVWNRSELPTSFVVGYKQSSMYAIDFLDYNTGTSLSRNDTVIAGYSHFKVRMEFKPIKIGDVDTVVYIENKNDENNQDTIRIQAQVALEHREDGVILDCGDDLDFGQCYAGSTVVKVFTLRNITQESLDIFFGTDLPAGEVTFNLNSELDQEQGSLENKAISPPSTNQSDRQKTRIEELILEPGGERKVEIFFSPELDMSRNEAVLTRLTLHKFRINISCKNLRNKERRSYSKVIHCRALLCTALVEVAPTLINFGDSNIGSVKHETVDIRNTCDLPVHLSVRFMSKIVTCKTRELTLPPHQTFALRFSISPRKVNPDYRKHVTIVNLDNRLNDNIIEIRSNNTDENMITFHALFYDVVPKSIEFDTVAANEPSIRSIVLKNITAKPLVLRLESSQPSEISFYEQGTFSASVAFQLERNSQLSRKSAEERISRFVSQSAAGPPPATSTTSSSQSSPTTLVATPGITSSMSMNFISTRNAATDADRESPSLSKTSSSDSLNDADSPNLDQTVLGDENYREVYANFLHALVKSFEETARSFPQVGDTAQEIDYVRTKIRNRKNLEHALEEAVVMPCSTISLKPESPTPVYIVYRPHSKVFPSTSLRKIDEKIFIHLLEFDKSLQKDRFSESDDYPDIPPRELALQAKVGSSAMGLAQRNINFGAVLTSDILQKTFTISNTSEVPLLYCINKSGSIASGDLHIVTDRMGIVRQYGSTELKVEFRPSLSGKLQENLTIENVQDKTDTQCITFKAIIKKPENFSLKSSDIDFGSVFLGDASHIQTIVLSNTTKRTRSLTVKTDPNQCTLEGSDLEMVFGLEGGTSSTVETNKTEEEIEKLEHKLRIAQRKGKHEKATKLLKRIDELKQQLSGEPTKCCVGVDSDTINSEDERGSSRRFKSIENGISFTIAGCGMQVVTVCAVPKTANKSFAEKFEKGTGTFLVFESGNQDVIKIVPFTITVYYDRLLFSTYASFSELPVRKAPRKQSLNHVDEHATSNLNNNNQQQPKDTKSAATEPPRIL